MFLRKNLPDVMHPNSPTYVSMACGAAGMALLASIEAISDGMSATLAGSVILSTTLAFCAANQYLNDMPRQFVVANATSMWDKFHQFSNQTRENSSKNTDDATTTNDQVRAKKLM